MRVLGYFVVALCAYGQSAPVDFQKQVEPILKTRCRMCHGAQQQLSGLRLDDSASAMKGGYSGPVIIPGKAAESRLIHAISGTGKAPAMPPGGARLSAEQIAILRTWIDQGAKWPATANAPATAVRKPAHWSFIAPKRVNPPAVKDATRVKNPIDAFVLARLEKEGLTASPEADRPTLIRRASLDLTGMPPEPDEVDAFVNDPRADAYERMVDRLLASPHYGERWARHWLDLARYADSDGYEKDLPRPHAWRYRHWLIEALNQDLPFDQFTIQTIAGDLLPGSTSGQKIATGFHRNTLTNREGGTNPEQFRFEQVLDRTSTLGTVWLGLTVGCAQCHDHKYDPISQKDFYSLFAYFNKADEYFIDAPLPGEQGPYLAALPRYRKEREALFAEFQVTERQAAWEARMSEAVANPGKSFEWDFALNVLRVLGDRSDRMLELGPSHRTEKQNEEITRHFIQYFQTAYGKERAKELKWSDLQDRLKKLDEQLPWYSQAPVLLASIDPRNTHIAIRGDWREPGIAVTPSTPASLHPGKGADRLALAQWLVSPDNPLTARVTVNRFWNEFFGRGIVRTTEDFGKQGEAPSHPELLDWLAIEFIERGWSMKQMHRLIVTSATYRQSSKQRAEVETKDPANVLLARQNRLRVPAEFLRDSALSASGLLNTSIGGKSIRPPQPEGVAALGYANSVKWEETKGPERYRRGLYIHFQRTTPYPMLMNFDSPDSTLACTRRQRSNTPLQALNLLNDPVFFEAAQALADRLLREREGTTARLDYAFRLVLARPATPNEKDRLSAYLETQKQIFDRDRESAALVSPLRPDPEPAAWVALSRVLLNLDEFMNRE
jgi:hypothetical protein